MHVELNQYVDVVSIIIYVKEMIDCLLIKALEKKLQRGRNFGMWNIMNILCMFFRCRMRLFKKKMKNIHVYEI